MYEMINDQICVNLAYLLAYLEGAMKVHRKHPLTAYAVQDYVSKKINISPEGEAWERESKTLCARNTVDDTYAPLKERRKQHPNQ